MDVIISEWALDSYLDLKHRRVFSKHEYRTILRPDAELLKIYPNDPKFNITSFWGPAKNGTKTIHGGNKMKWHNIGPGKVQLRLLVAMATNNEAVLCRSYVKDLNADRREMAKMKFHMNKVFQNTYTVRGRLR